MFSDHSIRLMIQVSRLVLFVVALLLIVIAIIEFGGSDPVSGLSTLAGAGLFVVIFGCVQLSTRSFRVGGRNRFR